MERLDYLGYISSVISMFAPDEDFLLPESSFAKQSYDDDGVCARVSLSLPLSLSLSLSLSISLSLSLYIYIYNIYIYVFIYVVECFL